MGRSPSSTLRTPVALFVFNRPAYTQRVFDAIASARPPQLLIVADGPRPDHPDDLRLVRDTRAVLTKIDWPCEVQRNFSEVNLGCRRRVSSGLDWVFSEVDEAIILEDDTVPHPTFFGYCQTLLQRYRDRPDVHHISGSTVLSPHRFDEASYYFSRCYQIWGWASWARAWAHYDLEMQRWPDVRDTGWLESLLGGPIPADIVRDLFDLTHAGQIPTWDFQWVFSSWIAGGVSLASSVNLVTNIGYGEFASHEVDPEHPNSGLPSLPADSPIRDPRSSSVNRAADDAIWRLIYPSYFARTEHASRARRLFELVRARFGSRL